MPETRREMIRQVKSLVREVHYESAGTVEFLVDKVRLCIYFVYISAAPAIDSNVHLFPLIRLIQ